MKAQPKESRARVQNHDRLQDVPLTQEWLASSRRETSRAKPLRGHGEQQRKVLFRDQEQVWAKVRP